MGIMVGDRALTWEERFWRRVEKTDSCWLWRGGQGVSRSQRYGVYKTPDGKRRGAHVIAYELTIGPVPPGKHLDHLCKTTLCVNPAHLEPVTPAENNRRSDSLTAANLTKTHCPQGHPYDEANTYRDGKGSRCCRECRNEASRRAYRRADKAARNASQRRYRARKRAS
jgi:hypothetical protein